MLKERLRRFATSIVLAYRERGVVGGTRFVWRSVQRKFSLLLAHQKAQVRVAKPRAALRARREAAPGTVFMAFHVSGGIGDALVAARYIRDVAATIPGMRFDLFVARPPMAAWVFKGIEGLDEIHYDSLFDPMMGDYDMAIGVCQFVITYAERWRWTALHANPALAAYGMQVLEHRAEIDEYVAQHPYLDHVLAAQAVRQGFGRRNYLHHLSATPYGGDSLPVALAPEARARFGLEALTYVTVHNGFDPDFVVTDARATKCYPHFGAVVSAMRAERPDLVFVQIGTVTSEPLPECDHDLINRTSLADVAALIQGAALHIDNEGGLVHLAACLGTRSLAVFGPTPSDYFGYPGNINAEPPVCGGCWWSARSWMDHCPKAYDEPRCVTEQDPAGLARLALAALPPPPAPAAPAVLAELAQAANAAIDRV